MEVVIIGAGLSGMVMALYLAKRGYDVSIFEKVANATEQAFPSKHSTELDLSARALLTLSELNLLTPVLHHAVPTTDRVNYFANNTHITIPHSPQHDCIYNIARADLYKILYSAIQHIPNIHIHFSHQLISVDRDKHLFVFKHLPSEKLVTKHYLRALGCDGANSILQKAFNHAKAATFSHVYKEMKLPHVFTNNLSSHNMYKWCHHNVAFLAHPNKAGAFSGTLVLHKNLEYADSPFLSSHLFPAFSDFKNTLHQQFISKSFSHIQSKKISQQYAENILLLGDSAHSITPFLGQGINCAFEDCRLFNKVLELTQDDWHLSIKRFAKKRAVDTDALIDMSRNAYAEFNKVYDFFQHRFTEKLKLILTKRYPGIFKTYRYLLAFTHQPYASVKRVYDFQNSLFDRIYASFKLKKKIEWHFIEKLLNEFDPYTASVHT